MFREIKVSEVKTTYNGKSGCMCGCNGKYNETGKAVAVRVKKVNSFIGPMRPDSNDRNSYSSKPFCGDRYVAVEEGGRVTAVYF